MIGDPKYTNVDMKALMKKDAINSINKSILQRLENESITCFRCGKKIYPTIEDVNFEKQEIRLGHKYITYCGQNMCDECAKKLSDMLCY